jgi:hypothetical protein
MTVDFYLVAIDRDVAFDQCEVNVDGFRIARQDRDKIGFSQLRQMAPIGSSTQFVKGRLDDRRVLKGRRPDKLKLGHGTHCCRLLNEARRKQVSA